MDEIAKRVSGTASMTVTKVEPNDIHYHDSYRYDGVTGGAGEGDSERRDHGRLVCVKDKCETPTDGSGTFLNPLLWGTPPATIRAGVTWTVHIDRAWELGPSGDQTVTVISADPSTGTTVLKREGSGEGFFDSDAKQLHITREGKSFQVDLTPARAHWIGQTIFRHGVVLADELVVERPVTLTSADAGKINAMERQYILLNAAP